MRVIAGKYKSRQLKSVKSNLTRPTTDRNKENLFNIIGPYFDGGAVLDLFAGSGGLGIEALSRGYEHLYSVDNQYAAFQVIKENFTMLKLANAHVYKLDYRKALKRFANEKLKFDLILLDPPYGKGLVDDILEFLIVNEMLNDECMIVVEELKDIAVYAGTFDPVTNGHLDIIERASRMFDTLYVTICINPNKQGLFSIDERKELLKAACQQFDNVIIDSSDKLSVEYAKDVGSRIIVRGIRATMDFEYELQLAFSNQYLDKEVDMVFLMTKPSHSFISSSAVKEMVSHNRSVAGLVPPCVESALRKKYQGE